MCDTAVAVPAVTARGSMLFAKNSDRQRNEAHVVELLPGRTYANQNNLRCSFISIPQVKCTFSVLICRPFWAWGAVEMRVDNTVNGILNKFYGFPPDTDSFATFMERYPTEEQKQEEAGTPQFIAIRSVPRNLLKRTI